MNKLSSIIAIFLLSWVGACSDDVEDVGMVDPNSSDAKSDDKIEGDSIPAQDRILGWVSTRYVDPMSVRLYLPPPVLAINDIEAIEDFQTCGLASVPNQFGSYAQLDPFYVWIEDGRLSVATKDGTFGIYSNRFDPHLGSVNIDEERQILLQRCADIGVKFDGLLLNDPIQRGASSLHSRP